MSDHDHHGDGVSRRRVLECMTWAGTGVLWGLSYFFWRRLQATPASA